MFSDFANDLQIKTIPHVHYNKVSREKNDEYLELRGRLVGYDWRLSRLRLAVRSAMVAGLRNDVIPIYFYIEARG